ncbi:MAG: putative toxin-antitoxin system toxin component, PIN family [Elusimicrobia bacterium]|nr:putative toxin-antitoxin system toxin component, PIN family [Elusimicrobiota bacterium]
MDRIVLDTNVFVSAYIKPEGISARLIDLWILDVFELVICEEILDEYVEILLRKGISYRLLKELNRQIWNKAIKVNLVGSVNVIKNDISDNKFLECAVRGKAKYIISGDKHLLNVKKFGRIKILGPGEFLKRLKIR